MIPFFIVSSFALAANAILITPPSGSFAVSMSAQALTDDTRLDPYAPADDQHSRRVMISTFMPVDEAKTPCVKRTTVPYMTPMLAQVYDELGVAVGLPNGTFPSLEMEFCSPKKRKLCVPSSSAVPLVLFSPGAGNPRLLHGAMAREIASHGLAVVTIDHPYDPAVVEFPDGTAYQAVEIDTDNTTALEELVQVWAEDTSFVLTHLHENPVPGIDLSRVLMAGHSLGGATAAAVMLSDRRVRGGIDFDGKFFDPVLEAGLDGPFALVGRPGHGEEDPTWDTFYDASRGPKMELAVEGTTHASFTDFPTLLGSLNLTLPEEVKGLLEEQVGTLPFGRAGEVVAGIVGAFAGMVLDGEEEDMFTKKGDASFLEVSVVKAQL